MAHLERFAALCRQLGIPHGGTADFYHVAGTNGKGSTTAVIQAILTERNFKTGATYSPYVFDVRERIQVDGELISQADFLLAEQAVLNADRDLQQKGFAPSSPFEIKTAMAFWHWNRVRCRAGVVEVGIGGRLDATNIIHPEVAAIVSIGFDHIELLGGSLEQIAAEKAGILKPGVPGVIGEIPLPARKIIESKAQDVGAPLAIYGRDWHVTADPDRPFFELKFQDISLRLPQPKRLKGPVQILNAALGVVSCLVADPGWASSGSVQTTLECALKRAYQPGRFQVVRKGNRVWVLDGAHNAQATDQLVRTFRSQFPGLKAELIHGMFRPRQPELTLPSLGHICTDAHFVQINWPNAFSAQELAEVGEPYFRKVRAHQSVSDTVNSLESDLILVTGSYYLLGEVAAVANLPVQKK